MIEEATNNELMSISLTLLGISTFMSTLDMSSDFAQGILLTLDEKLRTYGLITLAINWLPGIAASIHIMTNFKKDLGTAKALACCGMFNTRSFIYIGPLHF